MNGWILLHKKIWNSDAARSGDSMLVWIWMLTHADENGVVTCGRKQIAEATFVSEENVRYWTTAFLQKYYMISTIETTNKFSRFQICKWGEYQRKTTSKATNKLPTNYQQTTTNKELKNKELKNKDRQTVSDKLSEFEEKFEKIDVPWEWQKCQDYYDGKGKQVKDWNATFRNWLMSEIPKKHKMPKDGIVLDLTRSKL